MSYALYAAWCLAAVVVVIGAGFALLAACKVIYVMFLLIAEVML